MLNVTDANFLLTCTRLCSQLNSKALILLCIRKVIMRQTLMKILTRLYFFLPFQLKTMPKALLWYFNHLGYCEASRSSPPSWTPAIFNFALLQDRLSSSFGMLSNLNAHDDPDAPIKSFFHEKIY